MISRSSYALASRALVAHSSGGGAAVIITSRTMSTQPKTKNLVTGHEGVHANMQLSKSWRNKPLFRRQGDVRFRTGMEASKLLISEANRRVCISTYIYFAILLFLMH